MNVDQPLILDSIFYSVPKLKILDGVYMEIHTGKVTTLIGRNGAGKSTLLKIAAGQLQAASGITILKGERLYNKSLKKRFQTIGYLPQKSMLPNDIKVSQLIKSFLSVKELADEEPFIKKFLHQKVIELSGGERRFLELSLMLSLDRDFFLLDEPFTGVEPFIVEKIIDRLMQEIQKNRGILLTDHLYRYVSKVSDEAYLMNNRQCYKLEGELSEELKKIGYV